MRTNSDVLELVQRLQQAGFITNSDNVSRVIAVHGTNNQAIQLQSGWWWLIIDGHPEPVAGLGDENRAVEAVIRLLCLDLPRSY